MPKKGKGGKSRGNRRSNTLARNPKARAFLKALREGGTGNVTEAAERAGCARSRHYVWLERVEGYAEAFDEAINVACDRLEQKAWELAVEGTIRPVGFYKGKARGAVREHDTRLIIFLLRNLRPEKFCRDKTVADKGPVEDPRTAHEIAEDLREAIAEIDALHTEAPEGEDGSTEDGAGPIKPAPPGDTAPPSSSPSSPSEASS